VSDRFWLANLDLFHEIEVSWCDWWMRLKRVRATTGNIIIYDLYNLFVSRCRGFLQREILTCFQLKNIINFLCWSSHLFACNSLSAKGAARAFDFHISLWSCMWDTFLYFQTAFLSEFRCRRFVLCFVLHLR